MIKEYVNDYTKSEILKLKVFEKTLIDLNIFKILIEEKAILHIINKTLSIMTHENRLSFYSNKFVLFILIFFLYKPECYIIYNL